MSSTLSDRQNSHESPPTLGSVLVVACTTAPAVLDLDAYAGKRMAVIAEGGAVAVLFGDTSSTVDDLAPTATTGDTRCMVIPDGMILPFRLTKTTHRYLGYRSVTGTATLRLWPHSGPVR